MLPFDNKSELQVIIRMPDDSPLEATARGVGAGRPRAGRPAVISVQSYAGTSSPYTFNGLVRHYFLRRAPNLADLQVMLTPKDDRREQSHAIAKRVRAQLTPWRRGSARRFRWSKCRRVRRCCRRWSPRSTVPTPRGGSSWHKPSAGRSRRRRASWTSTGTSNRRVRNGGWTSMTRRSRPPASQPPTCGVVRMAGAGAPAGLLHDPNAREPVPIVLRLPREQRGSLDALRSLRIGDPSVAVGELTRRGPDGRSRQHLSQEPAAGDLRDRRRGGRRGEPGLRDPADEPRARRDVRCRRATGSRSSTRSSRSTARSTR